ncbi:hypothetical protein [Clostridium beijerinckii]|nr:hypothetical protein [Clostridium beijerinckii]MDG5855645.1 hypothetical protein [Clostridium beijerinckii]
MGVWELEVGNQYVEKVCDELASVLNLSNRRENKKSCLILIELL